MMSDDVKNIFESNKIDDLKRFLNMRRTLNMTNITFTYVFHIIQTAGIFITTYATGYNIKELIWVGVGLNMLASLINVFEKTNNSFSDKIMLDIQKIRDNTYIDEGQIIDDKDNNLSVHLLTN